MSGWCKGHVAAWSKKRVGAEVKGFVRPGGEVKIALVLRNVQVGGPWLCLDGSEVILGIGKSGGGSEISCTDAKPC